MVHLDAARAAPGFNLYTSAPLARAELLALDGTPVHAWADPEPRAKGWDHVVLGPEGDLYAINGNGVLERWSRDSRRLWRREIDAHHDLAFDLDGNPVVLVRRRTEFQRDGRTLPVVDDCLVTLDPRNGAERRRVCLAPQLADRIDTARADAIARELDARPDSGDWNPKVLDAFHTNSIVFLDRDVPGLGKRGDAILSVRQMNAVVVLDPVDGTLRFWWGPGELQHPHHATLLADDRVLVFDNGRSRRWSRVLELDPATRAITWRYGEAEDERFFSAKRGASQRLANGNVLVTDSESGRAFEVTRDGALVASMAPQKRRYLASGSMMTEAAIDPGLFRDLYIAMGEPIGADGAWAIRLHYKPMVRWMWLGAIFMGLGGFTTALDKRYRRQRSAARVAVPEMLHGA